MTNGMSSLALVVVDAALEAGWHRVGAWHPDVWTVYLRHDAGANAWVSCAGSVTVWGAVDVARCEPRTPDDWRALVARCAS